MNYVLDAGQADYSAVVVVVIDGFDLGSTSTGLAEFRLRTRLG